MVATVSSSRRTEGGLAGLMHTRTLIFGSRNRSSASAEECQAGVPPGKVRSASISTWFSAYSGRPVMSRYRVNTGVMIATSSLGASSSLAIRVSKT